MFALNKLMEFLQPIIDSFMSGDGGGGMAGAMEMLNALVQFLILGDPFMLYQPMAQAAITCVCIRRSSSIWKRRPSVRGSDAIAFARLRD